MEWKKIKWGEKRKKSRFQAKFVRDEVFPRFSYGWPPMFCEQGDDLVFWNAYMTRVCSDLSWYYSIVLVWKEWSRWRQIGVPSEVRATSRVLMYYSYAIRRLSESTEHTSSFPTEAHTQHLLLRRNEKKKYHFCLEISQCVYCTYITWLSFTSGH